MTPRRPTYRTGPASQPWHRDNDDRGYYWPRHKWDPWTPAAVTVAALRERHPSAAGRV